MVTCEEKVEDLIGKILVVDDLEDNREVLARRLMRQGCEVLLASSGLEALECIKREEPEVVLLDIMMPGIDGFEVIKRVRSDQERRQPLIIAVSARHEAKAITQALEMGADDYVVKPYDFPVVWARIEKQLHRSRAAKLVRDVNTRLVDRLYKMRAAGKAAVDSQSQAK